jgi:hypothetical protein
MHTLIQLKIRAVLRAGDRTQEIKDVGNDVMQDNN